jgi:hypothetical protein
MPENAEQFGKPIGADIHLWISREAKQLIVAQDGQEVVLDQRDAMSLAVQIQHFLLEVMGT